MSSYEIDSSIRIVSLVDLGSSTLYTYSKPKSYLTKVVQQIFAVKDRNSSLKPASSSLLTAIDKVYTTSTAYLSRINSGLTVG